MTDAELRAVVRDVLARHVGAAPSAASTARGISAAPSAGPGCAGHASHARFAVVRVDEGDDCVVEPGVRCNHCGFCQSYGH